MTKSEKIEEIGKALDEVRPHLKVDGGDVEFIELNDDMIVAIKWLGSCESCAMSEMTLKAGIAEAIKSRVPTVEGVKAVNGFTSNSKV